MNNGQKPAQAQSLALDANGEMLVMSDVDTQGVGLSKREHFASLNLAAILSCRQLQIELSIEGKSYASVAVHEADNLLIELEGKQ